VIAYAHEVDRGRVLERRFAADDLVVFRTRSGRAVAMEAWCPHLGAHFARTGARIEGECIRCAFHGFAFDTEGRCVETGYGTKPPAKARARTWPLREVNGLLLVYNDSSGEAPGWEVPALDWSGYTPLARTARTFALTSHPQQTTENSVDTGHLSWVHGYRSVEVLKPLSTDGPYLTASYAMTRPAGLLGRLDRDLRAEFDVHAHGLGYSFVDARVPAYGLHSRHFVLATPTDPGRIELRLALSLESASVGASRRVPAPLRPLVDRLLAAVVFRGYLSDAKADFPMWQNTRHTHPPVLAAGDGPIVKYRTWAKQFYPSAAAQPGR
jgi:nitrite reductase/ring-hydroxylating ferredoxin subunit